MTKSRARREGNWNCQLTLESLTASADQLAEKAESSRDMSILVKSNAMHKACKEKTAEMTDLDMDKQLADKLLELKNCE